MLKLLGLDIDNNRQRQVQIRRNLEPMGFELHGTPTVQVAKDMLRRHLYRLVLMDFDTIGKEIFNLCTFVRCNGTSPITIALMTKNRIDVEEKLFDCGIDDVVISKQTCARV
jgi:DNA-binding response OmpR family regulator